MYLLCLPVSNINGDPVTQTKGSVLISQGESVVVNCTYEAASPYLFWYVQFPRQPPRLFLRDVGREASDEGIRKGFDATHDKNHKSFHLWKPSSELNDSATYYCALSDTVTRSSRGAVLR
uniref:Ig-like domain-containing protein n=1 Tax=Terrapene triunguis TaxID=2587831 RepID=A0A674KCT1_9SAUR